MRISDIQLFLHVAKNQSLRQSAEELFISQQGLSKIIDSLENELGTKLLTRSKSGIALTSQGRLTVEYFEQIAASYRTLMQEIHNTSDADAAASSFTVYVSPIISEFVAQRLIQFLNFRFPNIHFIFREQTPYEMISQIEYSDHSLGIANLADFELQGAKRLADGTLRFTECFQEKLMLMLQKSHPSSGRDFVTRQELTSLPLAVVNFNRYSNDLLLQKLAPEGIVLQPVAHTSSTRVYDSLVTSGNAMGLSSPFKNFFAPTPGTVLIPIKDAYSIRYGCLTQSAVPLNEIQSEIVRIFTSITKQVSAKGA